MDNQLSIINKKPVTIVAIIVPKTARIIIIPIFLKIYYLLVTKADSKMIGGKRRTINI
jgi:hypothetical protein